MGIIETVAEGAADIAAPEAAIPAKIAAWFITDPVRTAALAIALVLGAVAGVQTLRIDGLRIRLPFWPHLTLVNVVGLKAQADPRTNPIIATYARALPLEHQTVLTYQRITAELLGAITSENATIEAAARRSTAAQASAAAGLAAATKAGAPLDAFAAGRKSSATTDALAAACATPKAIMDERDKL